MAVDAEAVDGLGLVRLLGGPWVVQHLYFVDTGYLEAFVDTIFKVIGPDVDVVGGEGEGFDMAVTDLAGVGRFVGVEDDLLLPFDGIDKCLDIDGIGLLIDEIGNGGGIVHCRQFALQALLQDIRLVEAVYPY